MLTRPRFVALYFDDQQRALDFFTGPLGCELVTDSADEHMRWIEVRPPRAETLLVLCAASPEWKRPDGNGPMLSPVWFDCDDLEGTVAQLKAAGVHIPVEPQAAPWDPEGRTRWAQFADPEGNVYGLSEQD